MDEAYLITKKGDVVVVTFICQPGYKDFYDALNTVLEQGQCTRYRLWDLTCGFDLSIPDIHDLGLYSKSLIDGSPAMVGVIAPDNLSFGLAKRIGCYSHSESIAYQVFRSQSGALEWMKANGIM